MNRNTLVVNLFGGPGLGKSTLAAEIFANLKRKRINAELIREYVKDFAWEERLLSPLHQLHIAGEQSFRELIVYNKVDVLVTDAPLLLAVCYQKIYSGEDWLIPSVKGFMKHAETNKELDILIY